MAAEAAPGRGRGRGRRGRVRGGARRADRGRAAAALAGDAVRRRLARGYAALGEAGWIGVHWPEALGGRGLTPLAHRRRARSASATTGCRCRATCCRSRRSATRSRASPRPSCRSGCCPRSPPGGCCSARASPSPTPAPTSAALRTTARDAGDRFVVTGRKLWTSSADVADWIYLAVRTGAAGAPPRALRARRAARHARHHRRRRTRRSAAARSARSCWRTSRSRATSSSASCTAAGRC